MEQERVGKTRVKEPRRPRGPWLRRIVVIVIAGMAGALIALGAVEAKGSKYEATMQVRSPTADASCLYFQCAQPQPSAQGNPYVLDQANSIESLSLAGRVRRVLPAFSGTAQALADNVTAKEIGASPTIQITYSSKVNDAAVIARTYALQYVQWSNDLALSQLNAAKNSLTIQHQDLVANGQAQSFRAETTDQGLVSVQAAIDSYTAAQQSLQNPGNGLLSGPNGATIYNTEPIRHTGATVAPAKAAALGAAAGVILAIGAMLLLPSVRRGTRGPDDGMPAVEEPMLVEEIEEPTPHA